MSSIPATAPDPRYLVGKFTPPAAYTPELRAEAIATIAALPKKLKAAVEVLTPAQLDTPYREGGWTVRQVVHHIADSHTMAVTRMRYALTEDFPALPGYKEKLWAELHDSLAAPVEWSLQILEGAHARWVMLLGSLDEVQWQRGITHSERGPMTIEQLVHLYAWHCRHHTAHITHLRKQMGW
ncbi:MAG TPA: putative metal-dependent hydrolase [Acidobacteriaceae bacterium]|jgi:hypothetical protein|nr:putative metal-dependent hydrolase [Acidobacteriaceae bacterium]